MRSENMSANTSANDLLRRETVEKSMHRAAKLLTIILVNHQSQNRSDNSRHAQYDTHVPEHSLSR
jgi:hypothetical protein